MRSPRESVNSAKGSFDGPAQNFQINADDQLLSSAGYRDLVVAYKNGAPICSPMSLRVSDGIENTKLAAWMNETPAVIVNIQRQPGANTIQVVTASKICCPSFRPRFPPRETHGAHRSHQHHSRFGPRRRVRADAHHCAGGDGDLSFLRSLSATIIPSVAVPLSLIGTFAVCRRWGTA